MRKYNFEEIEAMIAKAERGEYGEESPYIKTVLHLAINIQFEKLAIPFICGTFGLRDEDTGMHAGYSICPTYGVDWSVRYLRDKTQTVYGPEW